MGIDCRLLWSASRKRVLALPDERFYVGMIHGRNTSQKNTHHGLWRTHPFDDIAALIGDDIEFDLGALSGDGGANGHAAGRAYAQRPRSRQLLEQQ